MLAKFKEVLLFTSTYKSQYGSLEVACYKTLTADLATLGIVSRLPMWLDTQDDNAHYGIAATKLAPFGMTSSSTWDCKSRIVIQAIIVAAKAVVKKTSTWGRTS